MIKVDIFSGFLGAGKTTLIKKLIEEAYKGEKIVLIENEFGDIGIDGGFLKDSGVEINEMNSGCICCTLVGDFTESLNKVANDYNPDRIIIEPSGVGKLSDVITAVQNADNKNFELNGFTTVVDAGKAKLYMKNFGEFFNNQVENASTIILSHTTGMSEDKREECVSLLRNKNKKASMITTDWDKLTGSQILETMEKKNTVEVELENLKAEGCSSKKHHHDGCGCGEGLHDGKGPHGEHRKHAHENCGCEGHDHDHSHEGHVHKEGGCCSGHKHEHDHDHSHEGHNHKEGGCCSGHSHDHDHDSHGCGCGFGSHDHEHHHADEVFDSIGFETAHKYSEEKLNEILEELEDEREYGIILRCKGIVESDSEKWLHFDYVPGEPEVRDGGASPTGMVCIIGTGLVEDKLKELFAVK